MAWVTGDKLSATQRKAVLNAYGYRWTKENEARARAWGAARNVSALVADADWLRAHAFYITRRGELSERHKQAMPRSMAER